MEWNGKEFFGVWRNRKLEYKCALFFRLFFSVVKTSLALRFYSVAGRVKRSAIILYLCSNAFCLPSSSLTRAKWKENREIYPSYSIASCESYIYRFQFLNEMEIFIKWESKTNKSNRITWHWTSKNECVRKREKDERETWVWRFFFYVDILFSVSFQMEFRIHLIKFLCCFSVFNVLYWMWIFPSLSPHFLKYTLYSKFF